MSSLYNEFNGKLFNYIRSKVNSYEDAEDILQEVFLKILQKSELHISEKIRLKDWVFVITKNSIIDYYRKKGKCDFSSSISENFSQKIEEEPFEGTMKALSICLDNFIDLLPDEDRKILKESEIEKVKQREISLRYGIPYSSLRSKIQRGRMKLKKMLVDCCKVESDRIGNILTITQKKNQSGENLYRCEIDRFRYE
ncbi:sigma-70 family RNA polymerase sigma factor [Leptospira sp. 201903071]|uniref:sigma-70 family RNA polymerase sigma factor n=1 Tax=Leptospira ainazelensis TaxID=2810034 RepID=UPI0019664DF0|nr:sigma-70 family RNA polymerase sigma factor [Leptospira ainazelensis]MBM9500913.1 sigma-70 family RNA polymerase sigma factor [Leptospira ainazelensis]